MSIREIAEQKNGDYAIIDDSGGCLIIKSQSNLSGSERIDPFHQTLFDMCEHEKQIKADCLDEVERRVNEEWPSHLKKTKSIILEIINSMRNK